MLFIIDCGRDKTIVHRVDYNEGKYINPKILKGHFSQQVIELFGLMKRYDCKKIVFDKLGFGVGFHDYFIELMNENGLKIDTNGNVYWIEDSAKNNLSHKRDLFDENLLAWNKLYYGSLVTLYKDKNEYKMSLTVGNGFSATRLSLNDIKALSKSFKNAIEKEENNE